jgi:hypothetical protein
LHDDCTDAQLDNPANVVTKDGNVTQILIPTQNLSINNWLRQIGLSSLADQLDAVERPEIDSAYTQTAPTGAQLAASTSEQAQIPPTWLCHQATEPVLGGGISIPTWGYSPSASATAAVSKVLAGIGIGKPATTAAAAALHVPVSTTAAASKPASATGVAGKPVTTSGAASKPAGTAAKSTAAPRRAVAHSSATSSKHGK